MRRFYAKAMTPVLSTLLGYFLFSAFVCAKGDYTPQKYMGLKGKVVSIRSSVYDYSLTGFIGSGELMETLAFDFDAEGNVVKTTQYNADSSYVTIRDFVYKDNLLFSSNGQTRIGEDVIINRSEYITTEDNTLRYKESNNSEQWIKEVQTVGKYRLEYSSGKYGSTKEESWGDDNNNIIRTKYLLVSNELEFANGTNTIEKETIMKYDKDGNVTETVHIEGGDTTVTVHSYQRYDKYGNWTEQRSETGGYFKRLVKQVIKYAE